MYKEQKIIALIPARGGSKSIPKKNLADLGGRPLLLHAIEHARDCPLVDGIYVSTEDEEIATVARENGARVIDRPLEFAVDTASSESVVKHAIGAIRLQEEVDYLLFLQPTSPFRTQVSIRQAIEETVDGGFNALITTTEDRGFFWIEEEGGFRTLFEYQPRRRQERVPLYRENSCIYLFNASSALERGMVPEDTTQVHLIAISEEEALDIDTLADLEYARSLFAAK